MKKKEKKIKKIDIKIAKTPEEELWIRVKEQTQMDIKAAESNLTVNKAILEMAEDKLAQLDWTNGKTSS